MKQQKIIDEILQKIPAAAYHKQDTGPFVEADYYGASRLIAGQLGIREVPFSRAGWRHGWIHVPLNFVRQLTVWGKDEEHFLLAQQEHVDFLNQHGVKATAVGMPFIYADAIDHKLRLPNSLLVMPPHTLPHVNPIGNEEQYVQQIEKIRHDFDIVVFCIHHSCYEHGIWPQLLKKYNFPMIIGANANQTNAIVRLQKIFSTFEFVTTSTVGSHLPYAAYCGAKVSIYGDYCDFSNYNFEKDPYAKANPDVVAFNIEHTKEQYVRQLVPFLFCQHPNQAQQYISWAQEELGLKNKKSAQEIAELLGWNDHDFQHKQATAKLALLKNQQKEITLTSILSMLELTQQYSGSFAIYGAGHIGALLLKILAAANRKPVCIFDKQYEQQADFCGVAVRNPEEIPNLNLDLILVASFAYKNDIKKYIDSISQTVLTWTAD